MQKIDNKTAEECIRREPINCGFSDSGILSLEWKSENYGILIDFLTGEKVSIFIKSEQSDYECPTTLQISDEPPPSTGIVLQIIRE